LKPEEAKVWDEVSLLGQSDLCKRSLASFDKCTRSARLRVIDEEYLVRIQERRIVRILSDGSEEETDWFSRLLLLQYLLNAKDLPLSGRLRSPHEFKGGELFFSAPSHHVSFEPLIQKFGSPQRFVEAGLSLGGRSIPYADEAFQLNVLPRIPLAYLVWAGDEEFGPRISVLFDETAEHHLPIDALWVAILVSNRRFLELEGWDARRPICFKVTF